MIIIKAGEWLTHEDGTKYAQALTDILPNTTVSSEEFVMADGSKPKSGDMIPKDVMRTTLDGMTVLQACVNGEWRDLRPKDESATLDNQAVK